MYFPNCGNECIALLKKRQGLLAHGPGAPTCILWIYSLVLKEKHIKQRTEDYSVENQTEILSVLKFKRGRKQLAI